MEIGNSGGNDLERTKATFTWQEVSQLNGRHNVHVAARGKVLVHVAYTSRLARFMQPTGAERYSLSAGVGGWIVPPDILPVTQACGVGY